MIARKKPESRPDVVAHDVQPEEAKQNADVDRVARDDAGKAFGGESFAFELHNRQADVQNGQTEDVAHQRLSVQVPQLGDEAVDAERNQQEGQRENHSWNGKKLSFLVPKSFICFSISNVDTTRLTSNICAQVRKVFTHLCFACLPNFTKWVKHRKIPLDKYLS